MNVRPTFTRSCLAILMCCGSVAAAQAQDVPSVVVRYADLNLASQAGVRVLYERIAQAAEVVCGAREYTTLRQKFAARTCRTEALDAAVQSVGNRTLTAMHRQKSERRYG